MYRLLVRSIWLGVLTIFCSYPMQSYPGQSISADDALAARGCVGDLCDAQQTEKLRHHGWQLLQQITEPAYPDDPKSPPAWDVWHRKPDRAMKLKIPGTRALELPLELVLPFVHDPDKSRLPEQIIKSVREHTSGVEVLYNSDAYDYILKLNLFDESTLLTELRKLDNNNVPLSQRDIPPFPSTAMIAKAIWVEVPAGGQAIIPIWAPKGCSGCITQVKVVKSNGSGCSLADPDAIYSSCFYKVDSSIPGSELILVGLHLMTKELPDWTWTTFWWHPQPTQGQYAQGRLPSIGSPWKNYLMNTTISMETPWEAKAEAGKGTKPDSCAQQMGTPSAAKICFNPFLEAPTGMVNAELSNCMNCHKRAMFPLFSSDLAGSPRRGHVSSENPCFDHSIRLDYLWSLAHFEGDPSAEMVIKDLQLRLNAE